MLQHLHAAIWTLGLTLVVLHLALRAIAAALGALCRRAAAPRAPRLVLVPVAVPVRRAGRPALAVVSSAHRR